MKTLFFIVCFICGANFLCNAQEDGNCLKEYSGYVYTVYEKCPPQTKCARDYIFSVKKIDFDDSVNYKYLIDSCRLVNMHFYYDRYLSDFMGSGKIKDFFDMRPTTTVRSGYTIDEYRVLIFGYDKTEPLNKYTSQTITAHEYSAFEYTYDTSKLVNILYPKLIVER